MVGMSTGCVVVVNVDFTKWHHDYQRLSESKSPAPAVTANTGTQSAGSPSAPASSEAASSAGTSSDTTSAGASSDAAPVAGASSDILPAGGSDAT